MTSLTTDTASVDRSKNKINSDTVISDWSEKLREYRSHLVTDPQSIPIKQLAFDISRELESGQVTRSDLAELTKELCDRALLHRANRTRKFLGGVDETKRMDRLREIVLEESKKDGKLIPFADFAAKWSKPKNGIVFTAHPTFLMKREVRTVLVDLIEADGDKPPAAVMEALSKVNHDSDGDITLKDEHDQVQEAIIHAQAAVQKLMDIVLEVGRELYPNDWQKLNPSLIRIYSWVGYDLDGRTDIRWFDSIRFRLDEKLRQVQEYEKIVKTVMPDMKESKDVLNKLLDILVVEEKALRQVNQLFGKGLENPENLVAAANALTNHSKDFLGKYVKEIIRLLDNEVERLSDDDQIMEIVRLRSRFNARGLSTAHMHFRINAAQLHNALRTIFKSENDSDLSSYVLQNKLDDKICNMKSKVREDVNFGSVALENTTAIRQFMIMAQIIKHIDGESPIRMLIAECESPITVLCAIYLAKLFKVEDLVDISPLFETNEALEHGAEIIGSLLKLSSYQQQIKRRGRLCVQTGFSDAGRFMGQIPAALAIERLQVKIARAVETAGIKDVDVLIFDTHGESMGRGAHPASLYDRYNYILTPWVRQQYMEKEINLLHEVSFQGGDGYVLFGSDKMAFITLSEMVLSESDGLKNIKEDTLYSDIDFSRDYYQRIKHYQTEMFENEDYSRALSAFGTNLLSVTGSRKSKRQFDGTGDNRAAPAEMRAIPHNAILQQLGYLVNVVSGIGEAVRFEQDRFAEMCHSSDRLKRLMRMVGYAYRFSGIKTLVAYASVFDDAYWVTRPIDQKESGIKDHCLYLADLLRGDPRHDGIMHLATYLREDDVHLNDVLSKLDVFQDMYLDDSEHDSTDRNDRLEELDLLHALRIALIQHIYLLAARIPRFSSSNDVTRENVMKLVVSLHIDQAVQLLKEAYPLLTPGVADYKGMDEKATYASDAEGNYGEINHSLIEPIEETYREILKLGVGVAHHYRAHG